MKQCPTTDTELGQSQKTRKDSEATVWERGAGGTRSLDGGARGGRALSRLMGYRQGMRNNELRADEGGRG